MIGLGPGRAAKIQEEDEELRRNHGSKPGKSEPARGRDLISETETKAIDLLTPSFLDDLKHEEELPPWAAQKRSSVVFTFHSLHVAIN